MKTQTHFFRTLLCAAIASVVIIGSSAQAGYIVTLTQIGPDVVANGSGAIDLTGLSLIGFTPPYQADMEPDLAHILTGSSPGSQAAIYSGLSGPTSFGTGGVTFASSATGDPVGLFGGFAVVVPIGYVSGTALSDTSTYNNQTFSSLGVTPGIYEWTWGNGADQNFTLKIVATTVPAPPVITSPLSVTATVGQQFTYQVIATNNPTSYSATNLPAGLTFNSALGVISGEPAQAGTKQVVLGATNGSGTGNATLSLTVQGASTLGISFINGTSATGRTGQPFSFQIRVTGVTGAATITATGLPPGLAMNSATGLISGTPTQDGSYRVTVTVHDGDRTATTTLQLTMSSDSALAVITSPTAATLMEGVPFSYTITAPSSAGPGDPTIFSISGELPAGLTFNPATGKITGTYTGGAKQFVASGNNNNSVATPSRSFLGAVQLFAHNSHGTATAPLTFLTAVPQLINISTRLRVLSDDRVLIGGFIVTGTAPKKVLVRAIGPSLAQAG